MIDNPHHLISIASFIIALIMQTLWNSFDIEDTILIAGFGIAIIGTSS
jgi:hypothetical protein